MQHLRDELGELHVGSPSSQGTVLSPTNTVELHFSLRNVHRKSRLHQSQLCFVELRTTETLSKNTPSSVLPSLSSLSALASNSSSSSSSSASSSSTSSSSFSVPLGFSEVVPFESNVTFVQTFVMDYYFGLLQSCQLTLHASSNQTLKRNSKSSEGLVQKDPVSSMVLGRATFSLGDVLCSPGGFLHVSLIEGLSSSSSSRSSNSTQSVIGQISVHAEDVVRSHFDITFQLAVSGLPKSMFTSHKPYLVIYKEAHERRSLPGETFSAEKLMRDRDIIAKAGTLSGFDEAKYRRKWIPVYRSPVFKKASEFHLPEMTFAGQRLCSGDPLLPLLFEVMDDHGSGSSTAASAAYSPSISNVSDLHSVSGGSSTNSSNSSSGDNDKLIGSFETTLTQLLKDSNRKYTLFNPKMMIHAKVEKKSYSGSGTLEFLTLQTLKKHSFFDFILGGLSIGLCVGIDFTASNGPSNHPLSLHRYGIDVQTDSGVPLGMNEYEEAMTQIHRVLKPYLTETSIASFGFGAFLSEDVVVNHCFPLTGKGQQCYVKNFEDLLQHYHSMLDEVRMSGPTHFAPLIRKVTELIMLSSSSKSNGSFSQGAALNRTPQRYFILVILTDGCIDDQDDTIDAIIEASEHPLSLVIVGLGRADFRRMEILDGDVHPLISVKTGKRMKRDIVQFVNFRSVQDNVSRMARETLFEIPKQVLSYASMVGWSPNPPVAVSMTLDQGPPRAAEGGNLNSSSTVPDFYQQHSTAPPDLSSFSTGTSVAPTSSVTTIANYLVPPGQLGGMSHPFVGASLPPPLMSVDGAGNNTNNNHINISYVRTPSPGLSPRTKAERAVVASIAQYHANNTNNMGAAAAAAAGSGGGVSGDDDNDDDDFGLPSVPKQSQPSVNISMGVGPSFFPSRSPRPVTLEFPSVPTTTSSISPKISPLLPPRRVEATRGRSPSNPQSNPVPSPPQPVHPQPSNVHADDIFPEVPPCFLDSNAELLRTNNNDLSSSSSSSSSSNSAATTILNRSKLCLVCQQAPINCLLTPCAHVVCCYDCGLKLPDRRCPVDQCRKVVNVIKTG